MALSAGVAFVDVLPRTTAFTAKLAADMNKSLSTVQGGIASKAGAIGKTLAIPLLAAGAASLKVAVDFENSFTKIAAITNTTAGEINGMKESVLALAGQTAQSPRELADALYFLSSAGLSSQQVMQALDASARASAVGLGETADVARLTANVLNAYKDITAEQAIDTLVAAVREGTADSDEFADALGRILPISSRAGVGFDEVTASLAALSNIGLDVNEGVTAMRGLLQALVAPGTIAAQTLAEIGISADEMRQVISEEGILGALQLLEERTGGNIDTLRKIIPNIRSLTGELGLTGENAEQVAGVFERVADSTGSLDRAMAATVQGPGFQFQQLMVQLETLAIDLGEALLPVALKVADALGAILTVVKPLIGHMDSLLLILAGYATVRFVPPLIAALSVALTHAAGASALFSTTLLARLASFATVVGEIGAAAPGIGLILPRSVADEIANNLEGTDEQLVASQQQIEKWAQAVATGQLSLAEVRGEIDRFNAENIIPGVSFMTESFGDLAPAIQIVAERAGELSGIDWNITPALAQDVQGLAAGARELGDTFFGLGSTTDALSRSAFEAGAGLGHMKDQIAEIEAQRLDEFFGRLKDDVESLRPLFDAAGLDFEEFREQLFDAAQGSEADFKAFRDSLTKDVFPEIKSAIADFRDSMVDSLNFVDDVFSEFSDKRHVDAENILREIEQQARAQERFAEDINAILERGGPAADAVAQSLIAMGEEGVTAADAIAGANKETFQGIVSGFAEGESAAREAAGTIQEQMVGTLEDIRDILEAIARKAWGVRVNLEGNAQTQLDNLQAQLQRLATRGYTIAVRPEVKVGAALGAIIPAQAGLITRPTVLAGEGGRDEAIIPLESTQGHRVLVGAFTDALREVQGGRKIVISGPVQIRMTDWGRGIGQMRGLVVEEMDERRDHRDRVRRMR